jgi:hypothetical protein
VPGAEVLPALREALGSFAGKELRGAVLFGRDADLQLIADLDRPAGETAFYVPTDMFGQAHEAFGHARLVLPYAGGGISCNTASLDWAVAIGLDPLAPSFVPVMLELVRCVRPGGRVLLQLLPGTVADIEDLRWTLDLAQARQLGNRYRVDWPPERGGSGGGAIVPDGACLFLDLTEPTARVEASDPEPVVEADAVIAPKAAEADEVPAAVARKAGPRKRVRPEAETTAPTEVAPAAPANEDPAQQRPPAETDAEAPGMAPIAAAPPSLVPAEPAGADEPARVGAAAPAAAEA